MNSETFDLIGYALFRACRHEANKGGISRAQFRVTFDSPKSASITWQKISLDSSIISWTILWKTWHSSGSHRRKIIPACRKPYITKTSVNLWYWIAPFTQSKHQLKLMGSTEIAGPKGLIRAQNTNNQKGNTFYVGNVGLIVLLELYVFKNLPVSQASVSVNTMGRWFYIAMSSNPNQIFWEIVLWSDRQ